MSKNHISIVVEQSPIYIPELRPVAKSITGCLLMQRLEHWFSKHPDGFHKFTEPSPGHQSCVSGERWAEELSISRDEFRTAFGRIGKRYNSRKQYQTALKACTEFTVEGKERFYLSFLDRVTGETWYHRNHIVVDRALSEIFETEIEKRSANTFPRTPIASHHNTLRK